MNISKVKFTVKDAIKIATPVIFIVGLVLAMTLSSCGSAKHSKCHAGGFCDAYSQNTINDGIITENRKSK